MSETLTGLEAAKADAAARDADVLAGLTRPASEAPAAPKDEAPAKPARRARKAPAPAAPAPEPEPKAEANGESARLVTRGWARRVAEALAKEFANDSDEAKAKVAYWIHGLPYGGADGGNAGGAGRWFVEGLPRPTTHDWR